MSNNDPMPKNSPYKCSICYAEFDTMEEFNSHRLTAHPNDWT